MLTTTRAGYSKFKENTSLKVFGTKKKMKKMTKIEASDSRDVKNYITRSKKRLKKRYCLQNMKESHLMLNHKFTIVNQREYGEIIRYITTTRLKVK